MALSGVSQALYIERDCIRNAMQSYYLFKMPSVTEVSEK